MGKDRGMGIPQPQPPAIDNSTTGRATVVETDHNRISLRFSLRTIFGISILFALAFAAVAVYGRDWTFDQHARFLSLVCLWAVGAYVYAHLFLAGQRWQHRRQGGLIRAFGGLATSRIWQWPMLGLSILTFILTIGVLAYFVGNHEGEWYKFEMYAILPAINCSLCQGMAIGAPYSRAGTLQVHANSIRLLSRTVLKNIKYEDIIASHWSTQRPETLEFLVRKGSTPKTFSVRVRGADPTEVDRVLLSQLGNRHTPGVT